MQTLHTAFTPATPTLDWKRYLKIDGILHSKFTDIKCTEGTRLTLFCKGSVIHYQIKRSSDDERGMKLSLSSR